MRLLQLESDGNITITPDFIHQDRIPPYAILSHTWTSEEVVFDDVLNNTARYKAGYDKLLFCAEQAKNDGLRYVWVDACCINKKDHIEFQEAINSIFRWFQNAVKCYVYLSDVSKTIHTAHDDHGPMSAFRASRWFTRGWTLPELLAPTSVKFFSREGLELGDKETLGQQIHDITGIPVSALQGAPLSNFSVEERFSWARHRCCTRKEDMVYCLLGIFGVFMPLIYGEGEERALKRLLREIKAYNTDYAQKKSFRNRTELLYHPLNDSDIRILVLHPEIQSEDLWIHLEMASLTSIPDYQALSYVWGQEPALHRLRVNESEMVLIRPNLFHALRRMRLESEPLHLWIDSICIDQANEKERNLQVQRMGDIFRQAKNVWIWLGEEYSRSTSAMDLIPQINRQGFSWKDSWWNEHEFLAFNNLIGRAWFERGWVLQEAAFSANSIVFCGDRRIDWRDLTTSVKLVQERLDAILSSHSSMSLNQLLQLHLSNFRESPACRLINIVSNFFRSQEDGRVTKQLTLETLVELGTHFETTDPRDTIYALINLANDTRSGLLPAVYGTIMPDYRKSILEVFSDFVLHCCHISESLDIICRPWAPLQSSGVNTSHESRLQDRPHEIVIPSWITPRDNLPFGDPHKKSSHRLNCTSLVENCRTRVYNAHHNTRPQVDILRSIDNGILYLSLMSKGIIIGEVTQTSMRMANAIITRDSLGVLRAAYSNSPAGLSDHLTDIARILCADHLSRRNSKTDYGASVIQWLAQNLAAPLTGDLSDQTNIPSGIDIEGTLEEALSQEIREYLEVVRECVWNRRTFRGKKKDGLNNAIVGLAPRYSRVGDQLCILYGCSVPIVLRRAQGGSLGDC